MEMYKEFKWHPFKGEIILWAVRWYCKYGISYRDLEEMMNERGVEVDHTTLYRWVQSYVPELQKRLKWYYKRSLSNSWKVDEIYIKVKGKWCYLYRVVEADGHTIDFYLSLIRNAKAAQRFLGKALRGLKEWDQPYVINTDKAGSYSPAIRELKQKGQLPEETEHRQVKYLNNIIEADPGKLKRLIKTTLDFKSLKTAYATLKGFEAMRTLKKKQEGLYRLQEGIKGEVRLIERCFYLGNTALADAMEILKSAIKKDPQAFKTF